MTKMAMFSGAEIRDRVWSFEYGWGVIYDINRSYGYPIKVKFDSGRTSVYTNDGKAFDDDTINQTLFLDEIKFEIPKKPFDLKAEYKKLKRVNFIQDKGNFYLTYYGDDVYSTEKSERWNFGLHDEYCSIGTTYYSGDNLSNFIKLLNDNKITFEQLEQVIKEVENEEI